MAGGCRKVGLDVAVAFAGVTCGCAPAMGPPLPPDLFQAGLLWVIICFLVLLGLGFLRRHEGSKGANVDRLLETVNTVSSRLAKLEERLDALEKDGGGKGD